MTKDDVVRMAREAGIHIAPTPDPLAIGDFCSAYRLERFAQAIEQHLIASGLVEQAVRDEREQCAKVCEEPAQLAAPYKNLNGWLDSANWCAAAIRARQAFSNSTNWICPRCKVDTRQQGCQNSGLNCPIHGIGAS